MNRTDLKLLSKNIKELKLYEQTNPIHLLTIHFNLIESILFESNQHFFPCQDFKP